MALIGFLLPGFRNNAKAVGNSVHEVEVPNNQHHIKDVLIRKASGLQMVDVFRPHVAGEIVQLSGKVQQSAVLVIQASQRPVIYPTISECSACLERKLPYNTSD